MKKSFANVLLILGALAAGILVQVIAAATVMVPAMVFLRMEEIPIGLTVLVTHVFILLCFGAWYIALCRPDKSVGSGLKKIINTKSILIIALLAVGGCFFTNFIMPIATLIIPESIVQAYMELMETAGFGESLLPTIAAVAIAPFGEELLFRGVVYHYACNMVSHIIDRKKAFYIANTVQALAFGIFHGNLIQGIYAFALGLLLGYIRERFGSIWAPIFAHILINSCSAFLWEPIVLRMPESLIVYAAGAGASFFVLWLGFKFGGEAIRE